MFTVRVYTVSILFMNVFHEEIRRKIFYGAPREHLFAWGLLSSVKGDESE